jgi:hypothetical protein
MENLEGGAGRTHGEELNIVSHFPAERSKGYPYGLHHQIVCRFHPFCLADTHVWHKSSAEPDYIIAVRDHRHEHRLQPSYVPGAGKDGIP